MTQFTDNLISTQDLHQLLKEKRDDVKLLDTSFTLPGTSPDAYEKFKQKRLPGARFFDVDKIADPDQDLPHMLPPASVFEREVGSLGISSEDRVILYGQKNVAMGPCRALWMFESFGHERVQLLNASAQYWESCGYETETGPASRDQVHEMYKVQRHSDYRVDLEEMKEIVEKQSHIILDARPPERFNGKIAEPRKGLREGHMPGARNLPANELIDSDTGGFKSEDALRSLLKDSIGERAADVVTTCGSGITACVLWQGLKLTERVSGRVYDGSWSEWAQDSLDTPVLRAKESKK